MLRFRLVPILLSLIVGGALISHPAVAASDGVCTCYYAALKMDSGGVLQEIGTGSFVLNEEKYGPTTDDESCHDACYIESRKNTSIESTADELELTSWKFVLSEEKAAEELQKKGALITPQLSVKIPGLTLSNPYTEDGKLTVNFLPEYIAGIYRVSLGLAAIFAIVMIMIGGAQYVIGSGTGGEAVAAAKTRITNAVTGLVLILCAYTILYVINPRLTFFDSLKIESISEVELDFDTGGDEGGGGVTGGTGTWENLTEPYRTIVSSAKNDSVVACTINDGLASPTGFLPNQGQHHWYDRERNGDYTKINNLDWAAPWGQEIYAPFAGVVTYAEQLDTKNKCGNRIYLKATDGKGSITICHAKDFLNSAGKYVGGATVTQGEVIGHLGGVCCSGQSAPSGWVTQCLNTGTSCNKPSTNQDCSCQPINMAGNTTGPHVHVTFNSGGSILSCLK